MVTGQKKELLLLICEALGIKGTTPENYVSHRWLSVYDVSVDTERMWDAYVVFYYSFLSDTDRTTYLACILDVYKKHNVSKTTQEAIKKLQNKMKEKKKRMTKEGVQRLKGIVQKVFYTGSKTKVLLHVYVSVLPLLKKYVMMFESVKPMVHLLNDKQTELLQNFMCCFIRSEKLNGITPRTLIGLQVDDKKIHLPDDTMFLVKYIQRNLSAEFALEVIGKLKKAYIMCAKCLQRKMPVNNVLLRSISAIDPRCRGHALTLRYMLKLPTLVCNVLTDDNSKDQFDMEARQYQLGSCNSTEDLDIVHFWSGYSQTYPHLTKMVFALLSCFHGPAVESSFSIMQEIVTKQRSSIQVQSFSAIQTVKYELQASGKTALQYFKRDDPLHTPVNIRLCKNMRAAYRTYSNVKDIGKKKKQEHTNSLGFTKPSSIVSSKIKMKLQSFKRAEGDHAEHRAKKQRKSL